ncbi:hypothetical protein J2752_000258 [Halarchaeum rubridurum]|uniref:Uncharacterized protein n=1 Tax=Halarchaeum rubridurum TaxID=489911 RepID=A0A830FYZ7_9EURY|nr:hypothetical protein [Halarchaeum rubridurum]MBP1953377.1 hypothetical protein [Halarchaeum rubridurum]GGM65768.1 hypothetical protein GCM10009017_14810 [Halarchaeum rubridurum]
MARDELVADAMRRDLLPAAVRSKPLQAAKFAGIVVSLVLLALGFVRVLSGPGLLDGQLLALVLTPVVAGALVLVVTAETLVSLVRALRADASLAAQLSGRVGYVVLRAVEAVIGVGGVLLVAALLPTLLAESTPAPAGVGVMLVAAGVGVAIFAASLVRTAAELFVYGSA